MAQTLRIFSDLHFLEGSCRIRKLSQLQPLFDGADQVVVNGDSLDTQHADPTGSTAAEIRAYFPTLVPSCTLITGNHDPDISETHELSLFGGALWVTHGDVLFEDMIPWSRYQPEIVRRIAFALESVPVGERNHLDTRLKVFRKISYGMPREGGIRDEGLAAFAMKCWFVLFPPRCSLGMVRSWLTSPRRAAALAAAYRPSARFIVNGHTHYPGVWRRKDGRVVINTGSFCPPLSSLMVETSGESLRVRQINLVRGEFRPGRTFAEFPLAAAQDSPIPARS